MPIFNSILRHLGILLECQSYGNFVLSLSGNRIIANLSGAFNKQGTEDITSAFKALVYIDYDSDWGSIMDMTDFEMQIPEAVGQVIEGARWSRFRG